MKDYSIFILDPETLEYVYSVKNWAKGTTGKDALQLFLSAHNWKSNWIAAVKEEDSIFLSTGQEIKVT